MTLSETYQRVWHAYEAEHGDIPVTAREAVRWAVERGMLHMRPIDPIDLMAEQMSRALREEQATDPAGRHYRRNHALRISRSGVQFTMWATIENADVDFMEGSFRQRRDQIIGACVQLSLDQHAYNALHSEQEAVQLSFDFDHEVKVRVGDVMPTLWSAA